jgi:hypothetical protein
MPNDGLDFKVTVRGDEQTLIQLETEGLPATVVRLSDSEALRGGIGVMEVERAQTPARLRAA